MFEKGFGGALSAKPSVVSPNTKTTASTTHAMLRRRRRDDGCCVITQGSAVVIVDLVPFRPASTAARPTKNARAKYAGSSQSRTPRCSIPGHSSTTKTLLKKATAAIETAPYDLIDETATSSEAASAAASGISTAYRAMRRMPYPAMLCGGGVSAMSPCNARPSAMPRRSQTPGTASSTATPPSTHSVTCGADSASTRTKRSDSSARAGSQFAASCKNKMAGQFPVGSKNAELSFQTIAPE
mmetsp:Transcript_17388/g.69867  ORF Transcript_17388/g.69867 Transcript_17388/m.69867 type:complete len:241 (+) Transcript_17388:1549-2271(+)